MESNMSDPMVANLKHNTMTNTFIQCMNALDTPQITSLGLRFYIPLF